MRDLIARLGLAALQVFGVSILAFAFMELAPGDYFDDMKINPQISAETVETWRRQFGLQENAAVRYLRWSSSALRGEFGLSMAYGVPVSELIWERLGNTLLLSLCGLATSWLIAVPVGVWCGWRPRGFLDRIAGGLSSALLAIPDLLVGLLILAAALHWGAGPIAGRLWPAVAGLACLGFPAVFRHTRSSIGQVLALPFIDHLRACGVSEPRILFVHALRAAANPLASLLGLSLAALTSSSLIIEVTLSWPGLGPLLLESILARDAAVVLAAVLLSSVLLLIGNLAASLLLTVVDPRIRREDQ